MKGKVVFVLGLGAVGATMAVVHWQQENDKAEMRKGVHRDLARIKRKKEEMNEN